MMSAAHARHQVHDIEIAARRDGTMLGVRDRIGLDLGACAKGPRLTMAFMSSTLRLTGSLFRQILQRIERLAWHPT
jgi:CO/xanthine dehydrogenase Mo-binding subunit